MQEAPRHVATITTMTSRTAAMPGGHMWASLTVRWLEQLCLVFAVSMFKGRSRV